DLDHPQVSQIVHFYDCSDDPDGFSDIVQFGWDFNDDGLPDKFGQNTTKSWSVGGDYPVQHKVTDTANNFDWLDEPLLIEVNGPPVAAAEADKYSVKMGELVTITNLSIDDDGNGAIKDVYWDVNGNDSFDDPVDIKNQNEIQLSFYAGGIHEIGLKVVDIYGLEDILDPPLEITVEGFDPFCVNLIDQKNSAESLYGVRTFNYFQGAIGDLSVSYKATNGPWDFTDCPPSQPAICKWLLPTDPEVSTPKSYWPDADYFFKEGAPVSGGSIYAPHRFQFSSPPDNGILWLEGQWQSGQEPIEYNDTFGINHPICHPWADSGAGTGSFFGWINVDITWSMTSLGTGPAIFIVGGEEVVLNCMLIRHNISFIDTEYGYLNFSLLNYQWIDEDGNEVAFMEAQNGAGGGTNFSGNSYTGEVICRSLTGIQ
ncbi:MAG: hypothetical protein ABIC40_08410, partial [bacterium]